jgi:hypothetical protein
MGETAFPTKPFYIQSKIGMSNYALTVESGQIKTRAIQGNVNFLWSAQPDKRGGSVLTNIGSGLVLTAQLITPFPMFPTVKFPGGPLLAQGPDPSSALQLFRAEDLGGNWRGINSVINWEMKVNVYGSDVNGTVGLYKWDGGANNEEWLLIEESAQVETVSIDYHTNLAKVDLSLPPKWGDVSPWDNRQGAVPLTGNTTITSTVTDSKQITNSVSDTTGKKYTQTFGMKGGVDKVWEASASASFEESSSQTISFTDSATHTTTETISKTVNYNVPPGKKYEYQLLIHMGKVDVPYTAHMRFQSVVPGSTPVLFDSEGVFTGVNQTQSEVVLFDRTAALSTAHTMLDRMEGTSTSVKKAGA